MPEAKLAELRPHAVNQAPARTPEWSLKLYSMAGAKLSWSLNGPPTGEVVCPEKVFLDE